MWDQSKETLFKCDLSKKIASHSGEFGVLLSILSLILTLTGFGATYVQIKQANESYQESARQFQQSGPVFSWFDEDYYASSMSSDGTGRQIGAIVLSNTGRTSGSIIAVKRDGESGNPMTLCMPSFTEDGRYDKTVKPTVGTGLAALEPGNSRLVFYMTGDNGRLDRTNMLRIVTTSGQTIDAARIRNVSRKPWTITRLWKDGSTPSMPARMRWATYDSRQIISRLSVLRTADRTRAPSRTRPI